MPRDTVRPMIVMVTWVAPRSSYVTDKEVIFQGTQRIAASLERAWQGSGGTYVAIRDNQRRRVAAYLFDKCPPNYHSTDWAAMCIHWAESHYDDNFRIEQKALL